jgi:hypothetical protein
MKMPLRRDGVMDDLDAYEYRLKFDACRAELAALRAEREDRVTLLEGLLREAVVFVEEALIGSVSPSDLRLLRRINAALAGGG